MDLNNLYFASSDLFNGRNPVTFLCELWTFVVLPSLQFLLYSWLIVCTCYGFVNIVTNLSLYLSSRQTHKIKLQVWGSVSLESFFEAWSNLLFMNFCKFSILLLKILKFIRKTFYFRSLSSGSWIFFSLKQIYFYWFRYWQ